MKCSHWGKTGTCQAHNEQLDNSSGPLTSVRIKVTRLWSDCSFSWIIPALSMFTHFDTFLPCLHILSAKGTMRAAIQLMRFSWSHTHTHTHTHTQRHSVMLSWTAVFPGNGLFFFLQIALTNNPDSSRLPIRVGKTYRVEERHMLVYFGCVDWWGMRNGLLWLYSPGPTISSFPPCDLHPFLGMLVEMRKPEIVFLAWSSWPWEQTGSCV